jgi:hypothetical protein
MTSHQLIFKLGLLGVGVVSACSLTVPSDDEVFARAGGGSSSSGSSSVGNSNTGAAAGASASQDGGAAGAATSGGGSGGGGPPTGGTGPSGGSGGDAGAAPQGGVGGEPVAPGTPVLVNPSFEGGLKGWSVDPPSAADASEHAPAKPPVFQQWGGEGAANVQAVDGDYVLSTWYESAGYSARIYQVLEGLEDGTYTLKAHVANIATINTAELYAKGCSDTDPAPLALSGSETLIERVLEGIEVEGGTCEVGINIEAKAADWVNVDLFSFEKAEPIE